MWISTEMILVNIYLNIFYIFHGHLFLFPVLIYTFFASKLKLSEAQLVMEEESEQVRLDKPGWFKQISSALGHTR